MNPEAVPLPVSSRLLRVAPLLLAAAVILGYALQSVVTGFIRPAPISPWESGHIVDAWRWAEGQDVYALPGEGHATDMYGPLPHVLVGLWFRIAGPSNHAYRVVSLASGVLLCLLVALVVMRGAPLGARFAGFAVMFGLDYRVAHYMTAGRPDYAATMLGGLAVALFAAGSKRRPALYGAGLVVLVVGTLFKQTAALAAAVPAVVLLWDRSRSIGERLLLSALPLLSIALLVGTIRLSSPALYYYMFELPSKYRVIPRSALANFWFYLATVPIFWVTLTGWLAREERAPEPAAGRWLAGSALIALPASAWFSAKVGGYANSMLPGLAALVAFGAWRIGSTLYPWMLSTQRTGRAVALSTALGLLLVFSVLPTPPPVFSAITSNRAEIEASPFEAYVVRTETARILDEEYEAAIELVRGVKGIVVCPQDPTIPLYARNHAGRQLQMEADRMPVDGYYTSKLPESVRAEVAEADHVLLLRRGFPHDMLLNPLDLTGMGYRRSESPLQSYMLLSRSRNQAKR
jgi:hypothetical protein